MVNSARDDNKKCCQELGQEIDSQQSPPKLLMLNFRGAQFFTAAPLFVIIKWGAEL